VRSPAAGQTLQAEPGGDEQGRSAGGARGIDDAGYREALDELIDYCRSLRLTFEAGSVGFSIRVPVPDRKEPVTLGWVFPPGATGWLGLTDVTLGYDRGTVDKLSVAPQFAAYTDRLRSITGVEQVHVSVLEAVRIPPATLGACRTDIAAAIGELVSAIGETG
jgi:hypothetical protein